MPNASSIHGPAQEPLKQALIADSPETVFMTPVEKSELSASTVLQELDALRKRLDQASEWFSGVDSAIHIAALAEEVERLCRQASHCNEPLEVESLLETARRRLDKMQTLLGVH